jgi:hypothetical protein
MVIWCSDFTFEPHEHSDPARARTVSAEKLAPVLDMIFSLSRIRKEAKIALRFYVNWLYLKSSVKAYRTLSMYWTPYCRSQSCCRSKDTTSSYCTAGKRSMLIFRNRCPRQENGLKAALHIWQHTTSSWQWALKMTCKKMVMAWKRQREHRTWMDKRIGVVHTNPLPQAWHSQ